MQTHEIAARLGIATSTVRLWTTGEFKQYFSSSAQGGRRRHFDERDAGILTLIVNLKAESMSADDIHATLKRLQSNDWQGLPDVPPAPPGTEPVQMMPREAAQNDKRALMREIAVLKDEVENLETELTAERAKHEAERSALQSALMAAREELGEMRGRLAVLQTTQRDQLWQVAALALAAVAVAALVIAALVFLLAR